jgi:hypothetical protein
MMSKSTNLRSKWVSEIKRISNLHLDSIDDEPFNEPIVVPFIDGKVILPDPVDAYSKLDEMEKGLSRKLIKDFLYNLLSQVDEQKDWRALALTLGSEYHKVVDYPQEATENVVSKVSSFIRNFFALIESSRRSIFKEIVQSKSLWQNVDDIVVFANDEIIIQTDRVISTKAPLQQIKCLSALKKILIDSTRAYGTHAQLQINIEQFNDGIVPYNPLNHRGPLFDWIKEAHFKATPEIEFLSKTQIKNLRKEIETIGPLINPNIPSDVSYAPLNDLSNLKEGYVSKYHTSFLIERFDYLISLRSRVKPGKGESYFKSKENISELPPAAAIIRYLVHGVRGFNPEYFNEESLMKLKIWISTLFYDIKGFTYDDIRKALERNKDLYNSSLGRP